MKRLRGLLLSARPSRAIAESFVIGFLFLALLAYIARDISEFALTNGWFLLCGTVGMWAVLRTRRQQGKWWQKLFGEFFVAAALGITMAVGLVLIPHYCLRWDAAWEMSSFHSPLVVIMLTLSIGVGYLGVRAALRLWIRWDRLQRRHMRWALTHAHLTLVVLFAAAGIILTILGNIFFRSPPSIATQNSNFLTEMITQITSLFFPSVMFALVLTGVALAVLLPPSAVFSYLVARRTTRRLESLAHAASALRSGDYGTRVPVVGEDEVAQLQVDFNAMAEDLGCTLADLQTERDRVAALLQSRRELVASVSHELRTPVATVRSYLEAVQGHVAVLPETARHDLVVMERELLRLQHLIDDLFTLSQTEAGGLSINIRPTDVGDVIHRRVEAFAPLSWQRERVDIVADVTANLPLAMADKGRLDQALVNLLRNALRHTPPGGIIAVIATAEADTVHIEVCDTGEGIPPEELPYIWERFYRGEAARAEDAEQQGTEPGAGLGLALVKDLIEAMGGRVAVASAVGEGSCFSLYLQSTST